MSRFIRIFLLVVVAVTVVGAQLHAQGSLSHDSLTSTVAAAQEAVLSSRSVISHRIVLYVPASSAVGGSQVIITVFNLADASVELNIESYGETGLKLNSSREVIEPFGVLEFYDDHLPAGSRLIAVEGSGAITGVVSSIWPDGSLTQIRSLMPVANNRVSAPAHDDSNITGLVVINFDADRFATLMIRHDEKASSPPSGASLYVAPMQIRELPAGSGLAREELSQSNIAVLIKRKISGGRLDYLAVGQDNLTSKDPHPGSAITTPFLCGGPDTVNTSFCTAQFGSYVLGRIHPALDIDKGTDGENRNNRVMATLPGTVVVAPSSETCTNCTGWGNNVTIRHLLADGRVVHSGYGHLLYTNGNQAAGLTPSDHVVGGQFVGYKGNTGASNGSHLHFEIMSSINTFEGGYSPCAPHWTPSCENGRARTATGSTTTEDPAPYRNGQRRALLPYLSRTANVPSDATYDVYGVANQRLYGALPLAVERSENWIIAGKNEAGQTWNILLPGKSGFVKTGYRDDFSSDDDGTDYRFYAYQDHLSFGGGYQIKFTILPNSSSKIVDNDSLDGFVMNDRGTDGVGLSDLIAGYYYSALAYESRTGQYAKWQPNLSAGSYKIAIHIPRMPYGAKASAVRYKIYQTATSSPVLSDPVDHRANHNQWVPLTANGGTVQSWAFDSTGYVGLSIDQSGGNDVIAPGELVGIDAVKFLAVAASPVLASVSVSGPSSVNENTTGAYTATATFSNGNNSTVTTSAAWSENSSATTISTSGILSAGSVSSNQSMTVTASYTYSGVTKSGTNTVTIVDVPVAKTLSSVSVSGPSSVNENTSGSFTAAATFSDGSSSTITPSATWSDSSSATMISTAGVLSVGSVSSNQSVTVTATYTYGGVTKSGTKAVTIVDVPVAKTLSSVSVSGPSSVNENTSGSFTATATFSDGSSSTVTTSAAWSDSSSATTISTAGVLSVGSVSSNQSVTVTATYTYGGVTKSSTKAVTIVDVPVAKTLSSVSVSGPSSVNENTSGSFTSTATFSDGSSSTVTTSAAWSDSSSATTISIAGVLSAGSVSSNQPVTVTATYTYGGITKSGTKAVTVVNILTYTSSPASGTYTSGGNVLKIKVTLSGLTATFTVAKQDGSAFTTGGVMTIRAGASYGCVANNNTYYWSYGSGSATTTATFNLSQYFTLGTKDLFAAIGRPSTYCDGTPPTYYSGKLTITAQ